MHPYLERTQFAAETLIAAIFHEEQALASLQPQLRAAENKIANLIPDIQFLAMNPDLDDEGLGQLKYAEAWDTSNEAARIETDIAQLTQSISERQDATTALCGALLQIAKRGITALNSPQMNASGPGRLIAGIPLERVIWEARNQSMHYEAPLRTAGQTVFAALAAHYGPGFIATTGRDLAREVINLLGWTSVENYTRDMESILP